MTAGSLSPRIAGAADPGEHGTELWRFALAFYAREEVAASCLALQERLGADVDIVLFGIFALLRHAIALEADEIGAIDVLVEGWRSEVVKPLRHLRTRLKSGPSPAPSAATQELRSRVQAVEIEAERIELLALAGWLAERGRKPGGASSDVGAVVARIARHFAAGAEASLEHPDVRRALRSLELAAAQAASQSPRAAQS